MKYVLKCEIIAVSYVHKTIYSVSFIKERDLDTIYVKMFR